MRNLHSTDYLISISLIARAINHADVMHKNDSLTIRNALATEADQMSELSIRSKAYWGYSREFMDACREELTVTQALIDSDRIDYVIAQRESKLLGYYAIQPCSPDEYELEALFVDPEFIGKGIGKTLMTHAKNRVKTLGGKSIIIQGDPHAEKFYLASGGKKIGSRESASISGHMLPLFRIHL